MKSILKLENVRKTYMMGEVLVPALRGVNFEVYEKDFIAVLGPSGSGKTTFLNIIGLLDRSTEGEIYVDGSNISKLNDSELAELRLKKFGFVFQTFQLIPWLNALQNVEIPLTIAGVTVDKREQKAIELLRLVGLAERMTHRPLELSGGEQQRVAIARALVNDPEIILADEPTGNLDSKTGIGIISLLKRLNDERGATIVTVTHDKDIAAKVKKVTYLRDGVIVKEEEKA